MFAVCVCGLYSRHFTKCLEMSGTETNTVTTDTTAITPPRPDKPTQPKGSKDTGRSQNRMAARPDGKM